MKVFVGLSGGVDSSVAAARLQADGHEVVGVYMKNWARDLPGFDCPWLEDYRDAKRVAVQLGIEFRMYDFQEQYFDKVVQYMIDGYKAGLTPNPDIMCNQEVKFKLFFEAAMADGAEAIATGHYAKVEQGQLLRAVDETKDQTYFLYRIEGSVLPQVLFPLGNLKKPEVRQLAAEHKLITADKAESMGICFIGKVGIKEFLRQFVETKPGPILDQAGQTVGEHDGALFYTIGQRHGLQVGGGLPYYVVDKDMESNTVFVSTKLDDERLWSQELNLVSEHWIHEPPAAGAALQVRTRHRGPLTDCVYRPGLVVFGEAIRTPSAGQSAVLYEGDRLLGGGIITKAPRPTGVEVV